MVTDLLHAAHTLAHVTPADLTDALAQSQVPETPLVERAPLPLWILATLHVLTATAWLGLDAAVVGAALLVRRRDLDLDVRVTFDRLRRWLELGPWATVILTVPLGLTLVWMNGYGLAGLDGNMFVTLTGYAAVWLASVVFVVATDRRSPHLRSPQGRPGAGGTNRAAVLNRVDSVLRLLVAGVFLTLGILALRDPNIFYNPKYAWKSIVFALVIALGWWTRRAGRHISDTLAARAQRGSPRRPAKGTLQDPGAVLDPGATRNPVAVQDPGSVDHTEATLRRQIDRMLVPAALSWLGIVVAVGLSVTG
jgi:hypothetical protein